MGPVGSRYSAPAIAGSAGNAVSVAVGYAVSVAVGYAVSVVVGPVGKVDSVGSVDVGVEVSVLVVVWQFSRSQRTCSRVSSTSCGSGSPSGTHGSKNHSVPSMIRVHDAASSLACACAPAGVPNQLTAGPARMPDAASSATAATRALAAGVARRRAPSDERGLVTRALRGNFMLTSSEKLPHLSDSRRQR